MSCFIPPPTSNVLDQEQRVRLIKSTRKLEAVLGTTPRLLEPEQPRSSLDSLSSSSDHSMDLPSRSSSRASHRSARIYGAWSANSSVLSFTSGSESGEDTDLTSPEPSPTEIPQPLLAVCADLPPKSVKSKKFFEPSLFLRLHNLPPTVLDISPEMTTPISPDFKTAVPPSTLVIPPSPLFPVSPTLDNIPETPRVDQRRKKMAKLARTLGENVPPELVFNQFPSPAHKLSRNRPRSCSFDDWTVVSKTPIAESNTPRRAASKVYNTVNVHIPGNVGKYYDDHLTESTQSLTKGAQLRRGNSARVKGKGWSGEWNHEMDDVMNKLRNLK